MKKIFVGSDHGGFDLKSYICKFFSDTGINYTDCGTFSSESVDYPDIAEDVCKNNLLKTPDSLAILICGTGIGISIAANKINGIRAALCLNDNMAKLARQHNNANVLCLGGRILDKELAISIINSFLGSEFDGGRHQNRIDKIHKLEN